MPVADRSCPRFSARSEGMRALSVKAARAAVVMFRGMLAQVVADKGSTTARASIRCTTS